ncbi:hypothetical protein [Brachybacterium subflavum]|uniref:hypothetical protein n=1 Tax=Brachybacterium subflavum TaxID=2585206 RepID=UPI0012664B8F|nr:hypothetical protein [Brachybacterium subflavum]
MAFEMKNSEFQVGGAGFIAGHRPVDTLAGVEPSDSLEAAAASEVAAIESAYVTRRRDEDRRKRDATDSEYWFAVAFSSRAEKESFLRAIGADPDVYGDKYLSGPALAALLGVEVDGG